MARFKKDMIDDYVSQSLQEILESENIKNGDWESELYDILNRLTENDHWFDVPLRYCEDRWYCSKLEAYDYFDDLIARFNLVEYFKKCVEKEKNRNKGD